MKILWDCLGDKQVKQQVKSKAGISFRIRPCCAGIKLCRGGFNKRKSWHERIVAYNCLNCGQDLIDEETLEQPTYEEIEQLDLFISRI